MTCKYNNFVRPTIYQGMYNGKAFSFSYTETECLRGIQAQAWWLFRFSGPQNDFSMPLALEILKFSNANFWAAITRSLEQELIPACKKYGLDVVVYNPLAGGLFSGKYKSKDIPAEGRYSDAVGSMGDMYRKRYFKDSTFEALRIVEPVAEKHGLTLVETAVRWVINHSALNIKDGNDGIIIGVSSLSQLDQNLKDCEKRPLPKEVLDALDEAWLVTKVDTPNYWHLDLSEWLFLGFIEMF